MPQESLKNKTVKGVGWSAVDNVAQYAVSFVVGIVLARLLSPDDYGLIGIIGIFTAICNAIVNGGFSSALIRKKNVTESDYNTVFLVNLVTSILLYFLIFVLSPLIAQFFHREILVALIRYSAISIIIGGVTLVQQTRLTKQIDFKAQAKTTFFASLISGIIGIILAILGYGVWALVIQGISSQTIKSLLLLYYDRWIPKFYFSKQSFNDLFGFGWKIMLSSLLDTIWRELYQVVIGRYYSPASLGQYTRAKQFSQLFSSNLTGVVQRVTYPVLSNIQDEKSRMIIAYRKIIKITMFITLVCMFLLGAMAEPIIVSLLGNQWLESATYLPLLCVAMSLYPLHAINLNMLQIEGRSDLYLKLEVVKKIIAVIPLICGVFWGILPMLWADIIVGIISYFLNSSYSGRYIGYSSIQQLKDILPSLAISSVISIAIWPLKFLSCSSWLVILAQVILALVLFVTICTMFKLTEWEEIKVLVKPIMKKIKDNIFRVEWIRK